MAKSFRLDRHSDSTRRARAGGGPLRPTLPRRARRAERGATLVEYGLILAVFALPTAVAINFVRDASKSKVETTVDGISHRGAPIADD
ncbi:MAG: hypothetical protein V9F03_00690 [Microthrixaceae bacterium]